MTLGSPQEVYAYRQKQLKDTTPPAKLTTTQAIKCQLINAESSSGYHTRYEAPKGVPIFKIFKEDQNSISARKAVGPNHTEVRAFKGAMFE